MLYYKVFETTHIGMLYVNPAKIPSKALKMNDIFIASQISDCMIYQSCSQC
jgi:hypothetical protein